MPYVVGVEILYEVPLDRQLAMLQAHAATDAVSTTMWKRALRALGVGIEAGVSPQCRVPLQVCLLGLCMLDDTCIAQPVLRLVASHTCLASVVLSLQRHA